MFKKIYVAILSVLLLSIASCSDNLKPEINSAEAQKKAYKEAVLKAGSYTTNNLRQFTPNQSDWTTFNRKALQRINTSHDPDGVKWISKNQWDRAKWDGTIYDPTKMSRRKFYNCLCPSVDRIRGIREVFYKHKPFSDNKNPTKAEVDEWHRIAINHIRALVGYTGKDREVKKDHWLFATALWANQRAYTRMWDSQYPAKSGQKVYGPCGNVRPLGHCGDTFVPSKKDQASYLLYDDIKPIRGTKSAGIFSSSKSNIPWSIKFSRSFCVALKTEGFWGGHVQPWFGREKFGFDFYDSQKNNSNSIAILRTKWGGKRYPNLYKNPNTK